MAVAGITVTNSTIQVSYEGKDPVVSKLRQTAKKQGMRSVSSSMGPQVTPAGVVKLRMMTIFHEGNAYEKLGDEIKACEEADVFSGRY